MKTSAIASIPYPSGDTDADLREAVDKLEALLDDITTLAEREQLMNGKTPVIDRLFTVLGNARLLQDEIARTLQR